MTTVNSEMGGNLNVSPLFQVTKQVKQQGNGGKFKCKPPFSSDKTTVKQQGNGGKFKCKPPFSSDKTTVKQQGNGGKFKCKPPFSSDKTTLNREMGENLNVSPLFK